MQSDSRSPPGVVVGVVAILLIAMIVVCTIRRLRHKNLSEQLLRNEKTIAKPDIEIMPPPEDSTGADTGRGAGTSAAVTDSTDDETTKRGEEIKEEAVEGEKEGVADEIEEEADAPVVVAAV